MKVLPLRPAPLLVLLTVLALAATMLSVASAMPAKAAGGPSPYPDDYDGSQMWLGYRPIEDQRVLAAYRPLTRSVVVENATANPVHRHTADLATEPGGKEKLVTSSLEAAREELTRGLGTMLGTEVPVAEDVSPGAIVVGTPESSEVVRSEISARDLDRLGSEGYLVRSVGGHTVIAGNTEVAALYGTYGFLRLMQTGKPISRLNDVEVPKVQDRWLNNWDVERLYAGNADTAKGPDTGGLAGEDGSIFNFAATGESADRNLPVILDRYITVARALASVGINGFNINNVNAKNAYITPEYIEQEAALADALRPYGIKLALSIRYDAPTDRRFAPDTLTREQLDPTKAPFRDWWTRRASMIQKAIPDFAGFTVKANSEGQPGPQDFGFDHGDGANGMAAAVEPLGMQIKWRTFVYNADVDEDRLKRAYLEFGPIDDEAQPDGSHGRIADNVFLQTKNGPLDFQPREPVNPMFGRMENTNQALELQVTQEYTGQSTMLAYLGPMWQEVFQADTGATDASGRLLPKRKVGHIVDGTAQGHERTAIVGVANLGNADNLTGHHFSQSNLFAFGRMAWDWTLDSRGIAQDWTRMTWSGDRKTVNTIVAMMMGSWESVVSYQTPLGIGHQFGADIHYEPGPDETLARPDWSPTYYNKADSVGLGYDRSASGSGYSAQYFPTLAERFDDIETTPENLLMWFHHVPWGHEMESGRPFWDELVYRYQMGVQYVTWMRRTWDSLEPSIDARRFGEVNAKLAKHEADAKMWRDECVSYWQTFSGREMPTDDGPTSVSLRIGGKTYDGFDLSLDEYTLDVPDGASPRITDVVPADDTATYEIVEQADAVPGRAVVEVRAKSFFGPLLKRYELKLR